MGHQYFHSPTDTKELLYDPASVMNGDTLKFCLKEAWCKLSFFVLSFFYYLYCSSAGSPEDEEHSSVCTVCLRHSMVKHCPAQHSSPARSHSSSAPHRP
eukprot:superscaffoldBa00000868_g7709